MQRGSATHWAVYRLCQGAYGLSFCASFIRYTTFLKSTKQCFDGLYKEREHLRSSDSLQEQNDAQHRTHAPSPDALLIPRERSFPFILCDTL